MKCIFFLSLLTLGIFVQCGDCGHTWLPFNIIDAVQNKTIQIKNFVKDKGRSLRDFYVENVQNRIKTYVGYSKNQTEKIVDIITEKTDILVEKFDRYLTEAEVSGNQLFDAVAPQNVKYTCSNDDPAIHMSTPQLIASHGYAAESHTFVTDDGYILTLHRIPYPKSNLNRLIPTKTVLLHHGLLGSSADWVLAGPEKGLAYILSNAGYDVWLANVRGNTYSRAHVSKDPDSFAFWNFTWHEVSQHDLPAVIGHIIKIKGPDVKINYVGHSMGTTILFALLSTKTEYNNILRAGFALAPVAYMTDIESPIRLLARYANNIEYLMKLLGANEFLPQNSVLRWLSKHACEINHYEEAICENSLFVLCGHDEQQFNRSLLPIILGHVPAGASTKSLVHYAQEIRNKGNFQKFDYGPKGNMEHYGTTIPPEYPLHKITLPIALFSAKNDWLSGEVDVSNLYRQLVNPIEHYIVPLKTFNHVDFLWAIDAPILVYNRLLELMEQGTSKSLFNGDIDSNHIR
ncbi:Lipase 3 [Eumeta japonica]|uniref:Lipase 3 n=1 Tax=Eumeta variegata TaxID=151549 RepID=A0A4C1XCB3_EUMVA|nr:Lipase 3 [Eumeta japonica]